MLYYHYQDYIPASLLHDKEHKQMCKPVNSVRPRKVSVLVPFGAKLKFLCSFGITRTPAETTNETEVKSIKSRAYCVHNHGHGKKKHKEISRC